MYYVTTTAKRKNAKRHIGLKSKSLVDAIKNSRGFNIDRYIVELYNGKWQRMGVKVSPTEWDITEYARAVLAEIILTYRKYSDDSVVACDTEHLYLLKGHEGNADKSTRVTAGLTKNSGVYCQVKNDKLLAGCVFDGWRIKDDEI